MKNIKTILSTLGASFILVFALMAFTNSDKAPAENQYLEKISKDNAAFVMVDYLTGFDPGLRTIDRATFVNNATAFAKISEIFNMPTVVLGDEGGFRGKFYPLVENHLSNDMKIERHTASAWGSKEFRDAIKKFGKKKIVIGGISIDICTQLTALDLLANGYEVYVVVDASGTDQPIVEQAAMMRLNQAGATMISWGTLASELMVDWQTPEGPKVGALYQEHSAWGGFFDSYNKE